MANLPEAVLSLIRTRTDLHRWSTANEHGRAMHEAVDVLEAAIEIEPAATVLAVTQKAIASALTVIARADDSSGIIGDACRRLLDLHPLVAARAEAPVGKLVDWMIKFQFDNPVDYFDVDPVAYAPALGARGLACYRAQLAGIADSLGPPPPEDGRWSDPDAHTRFVLEHNSRRLAVLDRDVEAIIRTHARDRRVARWLHDTAEALADIGAVDLAIDWAKQAADFDAGHQARAAADYWCSLLAEHRPGELLGARTSVFERWPSSVTAANLYAAAGEDWPDHHEAVLERLAVSPRDAVLFVLLTVQDLDLAWHLAHNLGLKDTDTWTRLVKAYQKIDPLAVLPVLAMLVEDDLVCSQARNYQLAARRLRTMRKLAADTPVVGEVDDLIAELRQAHRRRPRLQLEFDRAGLP